MNSGQIEDALRGDTLITQCLLRVLASDEPPLKKFPGAYVISTDENNQVGQHFFTINDAIEGFDRVGQNPGVCSKHISELSKDACHAVQCEALQLCSLASFESLTESSR